MANKKAEPKVQKLEPNPALDILALNLFEKTNGSETMTPEQLKEAINRVESIVKLYARRMSECTDVQQLLISKWFSDTTIKEEDRIRVLGVDQYNDWLAATKKAAEELVVKKSSASENNSEAAATIEMSGTGTMKVDTEEKKEENKMSMTKEEMQQIAEMMVAMKGEEKKEEKKEQGFFDELCGTVKEATDTTVGKVALVAAGGAAAIIIKKKVFDEPADSEWASGETQIASQGASMFF